MFKKFIQIWRKIKRKKSFFLDISKRQKFIISVVILSFVLFFSEQLFGKGGIYIAILLSIFTDFFVFLSSSIVTLPIAVPISLKSGLLNALVVRSRSQLFITEDGPQTDVALSSLIGYLNLFNISTPSANPCRYTYSIIL